MKDWLIGGGLALIGGGFAASLFQWIVVKVVDLGEKPDALAPRISPWLTGLVERSFFLTLVVARIEGVPEAMMAWLALKLAANWQRYNAEVEPRARARTMLALLAGLISLVFAFIGGKLILMGCPCGT